MITCLINTPLGKMKAETRNGVLCRLEFTEAEYDFDAACSDQSKTKLINFENTPGEVDQKLIRQLITELDEYFRREGRRFSVQVQPEGTPFQMRVWQALGKVPYGQTRTYAEQAKNLGDLKAVRAVAAANGRNPVAILIPCHRIVGASGKLTGYAGGISRKRRLLELEGSILL